MVLLGRLGLGVAVRSRIRVLILHCSMFVIVLYFIHLYSADGATGRYRGALNLRLNIRSVRRTKPKTVRYVQCRIEGKVVVLISSVFCAILRNCWFLWWTALVVGIGW